MKSDDLSFFNDIIFLSNTRPIYCAQNEWKFSLLLDNTFKLLFNIGVQKIDAFRYLCCDDYYCVMIYTKYFPYFLRQKSLPLYRPVYALIARHLRTCIEESVNHKLSIVLCFIISWKFDCFSFVVNEINVVLLLSNLQKCFRI